MRKAISSKDIDCELKKLENIMKLKNCTQRTIRTYCYIAQKFLRTVKKKPEQLCSKDVHNYMLAFENQGKSWSYLNQQACTLRLYLTAVLEWKSVEIALPSRKTETRVLDLLTREEITKILAAAPAGLKRTLLLFIYATGARGFEAAKLETTDIESARMLIRLRQGKGRKDRFVPLSSFLLEELRQYYRENRPGRYLFPRGEEPGPIEVAEVSRIWNDAKTHARISREGGVHSLRHAFATNMLEQGVDIRSLQQILGHTNIQSTARYLRMTNTISLACGDKIDAMLKPVIRTRK